MRWPAPSSRSELRDLTEVSYGHTIADMAITTIKSTYALDVESVQKLEDMARRWGVSKSEMLRRAIKSAAGGGSAGGPGALGALEELQKSLGLTAGRARAWTRRARAERQATSRRAESRKR